MKKFITNTGFLLAATLTINALPTEALEIVYPKTQNSEITASSTFFIGNTNPDSKLTINGKEVKVHDNGSFVEVVQLKDGQNEIIIDSQNESEHESKTYVIKKIPKSEITKAEPVTEEFPENQFVYASTVKNNVPLRTEANENAKRITHLSKDVMLHLDAKKGDYYRVYLSPSQSAWVKADNIVAYSTLNGQMRSAVLKTAQCDDKLYEYIKTTVSFQVPYKITETDTGLKVELFNIKENADEVKQLKQTSTIKNIAINTLKLDSVSTYYIDLNQRLWGYDAYYDENTFVLKIRKAPKINPQNPLKDISITIDAGHGGSDSGAVGPTGVKEKDINLDISKKLQKILEEKDAELTMTRTEDCSVELYKRAKIGKEADSLFMISIHANALPDGADPYKKHGTSVFFYNPQAAELAKTIRNTMIKELETKDDGVCACSFVMTRPTMPLSVLVEVAYMIHPDEYKLLLDEDFRQKTAEAISKSLENYLLNSLNNNDKNIRP